MKILLTGANGFIGSNLLNLLLADKKNFVYALSRKPLGIKNSRLKNLVVDISKTDFTKKLKFKTDIVIHLAQSRHFREFPLGASDVFKVNVLSTYYLLEWSRKNNIRKFIFASTGSVYRTDSKFLTERSQIRPESFYAQSKYIAENLIKEYSGFFKTIILRIFTPYGPAQKNMLIPNIIERIKNHHEITLAKGKGIILSPVFIDDCCKMIQQITKQKIENGIYNLSGNEKISLAKIVSIIEKELKTKARIKITDEPATYLAADSSKLYKAIKFIPSASVKEGLKKTLKN